MFRSAAHTISLPHGRGTRSEVVGFAMDSLKSIYAWIALSDGYPESATGYRERVNADSLSFRSLIDCNLIAGARPGTPARIPDASCTGTHKHAKRVMWLLTIADTAPTRTAGRLVSCCASSTGVPQIDAY